MKILVLLARQYLERRGFVIVEPNRSALVLTKNSSCLEGYQQPWQVYFSDEPMVFSLTGSSFVTREAMEDFTP